MLLETMLFHTETSPSANFGNFSGQNDGDTLRCVLLIQNALLYMHSILSATIDSNWLNTSRYGHLKRVSNGKMQNFSDNPTKMDCLNSYRYGNKLLASFKS